MEKSILTIKGEITGSLYDQTTLNLFQKVWNKFVLFAGLDRKKHYILGELLSTSTKHNIICTSGLNVIARRLASDNTYSGNITKMALGTGTGVFDGSETQLYAETYRNTVASFTSQDNIAYINAYYTETEVTGSFTEFGNFIDGLVGANTGKLFSHIAVVWNKTNTNVLVVDCKYTLLNG